MSKSIETCGTKIQRPSNTADNLQAPPSPDSHHIPNFGDIMLSLSNENIHTGASDIDERELNQSSETPSAHLFIEDFISQGIDNRNAAYQSRETVGARGTRSKEICEADECLHTGRDNVDLFPSQFNQEISLQNQVKNLRIVVDIPDEENLKEQISPKENKDTGTEKSKEAKEFENAKADKLVVKVDKQITNTKEVVPKVKDLLNKERQSDSPRGGADADIIDFIRQEKERMRQLGLAEKFRNVRKDKKKKKNRRNNRSNGSEDGQDFDTLYRLPTEHLTRHRNSICGKDRSVRSVEEQLRLHEELNERRKMVEMEKEHNIGAVGGYAEIEENLIHEQGNMSPASEHSRDSSPTNEDVNVQRRFER